MALALAQSVLSFALSTTGSLMYIGFGATCTLNHYLGLGVGLGTAGYIAHLSYNDHRKKNEPIHHALTAGVLSMPLSFITGYGIPYVLVPLAVGLYLLYLTTENVEIRWSENEKYFGFKQMYENATTNTSQEESNYILQVLDRLLKSRRNEPGFAHKYSDADYKRIPKEEFEQIWVDAANNVDRRLRTALQEADRADQAGEVAKKVADLGFDADVQEDDIGQFIVYTGVSDPARRNEVKAKLEKEQQS